MAPHPTRRPRLSPQGIALLASFALHSAVALVYPSPIPRRRTAALRSPRSICHYAAREPRASPRGIHTAQARAPGRAAQTIASKTLFHRPTRAESRCGPPRPHQVPLAAICRDAADRDAQRVRCCCCCLTHQQQAGTEATTSRARRRAAPGGRILDGARRRLLSTASGDATTRRTTRAARETAEVHNPFRGAAQLSTDRHAHVQYVHHKQHQGRVEVQIQCTSTLSPCVLRLLSALGALGKPSSSDASRTSQPTCVFGGRAVVARERCVWYDRAIVNSIQ